MAFASRCTRAAQSRSLAPSARSTAIRAVTSAPVALSPGATALEATLQAGQEASPLTLGFLRASLSTYLHTTPSASTVADLLASCGQIRPETLLHDHFAFRTLGLPGLGIASVHRVLEELGYSLEEEGLLFPAKKLTASWFAHRASRGTATPLPRIFVSEIKVGELSAGAQAIIQRHVGGLALGPGQVAVSAATGTLPWAPIGQQDFEALLAESDYAAWVLVHGYALNHTALAVHAMRRGDGSGLTIGQAAELLSAQGVTMNDDGGLLKTSGDGLLVQCSSMSDWVTPEKQISPPPPSGHPGGWKVPGSYLELIERALLPQFASLKGDEVQDIHRREGFEVSNAAHLFTSTRTGAAL